MRFPAPSHREESLSNQFKEKIVATSTCPKCDSHRFEVKLLEPIGAQYKFHAVQCAACGAVVGVTEYFNIGARIGDLAKGLNVKLPS